MRTAQALRATALAALLWFGTAPNLRAQNSIVSVTFQQGGRASSANSGSTATIIAPGLNKSTTATISLTYIGTTQLRFPQDPQLLGSGDFTLQTPTLTPLTPLQTVTFTVAYKPTSSLPSSALLAISFQDATTNGFFTLNLNGTVPVVSVNYVPQSTGSAVPLANGDTIPYGQSAVFSTTDIAIQFINRGSAASQVNSIKVSGDAYVILGLPALPLSLPAGSQLPFNLRFQPKTPGDAPGTLQIAYDDVNLSASLTGTALLSVFNYTLVNGSATSALTRGQSIDLGDVKINGDGATVLVRFRNILTVPATVNLVGVSGSGLSITEGPILPATLQPQEEASVRLKYAPTTPGPFSGRLAIGTDSFSIIANATGPLLQLSYKVGAITDQLSPGNTASFPPSAIGVANTAVFSIFNKGTGPASMFSIGLTDPSGSFVISGVPALPKELAAGDTLTFTVTFTPRITARVSGSIELNGVSIIGLAGAGSSDSTSAPLQYSYTQSGVTVSVDPGGIVAFPSTLVTQTSTARFTLTNNAADVARVVNIGIVENQSLFQISGLPALPLQIAPKQSIGFTITYLPQAPGAANATLAIDGARFQLTGSAPTPPGLPSFQFTGASGQQQPFAQPAVGLSLATAYPLDVQGILAIATVSDTFAQDPAVRFSSGGQSVPFTIPANTLQAKFPGGATQIQLQTGTVSGSILITPSFSVNATDLTPRNPAQLKLDVPKTAPVLLSGSVGSQTNTSFVVTVSGYVTTRSLQSMSFTFTGDTAQTLGQSSIDLTGTSRIWFQSTASNGFGGQFSIQMPFTLRSDSSTTNLATLVRGITVVAVNEQGISTAFKIAVP